MSNIRTLTDIHQDSHSVQTIVLRETAAEDVSVQTMTPPAPRFPMSEDLREVAQERLNNGDYRLPIRSVANGTPVGDADEMLNLSENLSEDSIRNILGTIAENRFSRETLEILLSNLSRETLERANNILSSPYNSLEDLAPILNILLYAHVGFYDFDTSNINLSNMLADLNLNPSESVSESNLEEALNDIDENVREMNAGVDRRMEEYNRARLNIMNSLNWRSLIRRGGMVIGMGAATYLAAPYLGVLANLGGRILENAPLDVRPTLPPSTPSTPSIGTGTDIAPSAPRTPGSRVVWNDVSGSFWKTCALLVRFMGGNRPD